MEKGLFHDLYKRLNMLDVRAYSPDQLSGLLHGYLTVYSMVRVYPWLEEDFGHPGGIHEQAKEIARLYSGQLRNEDVPVNGKIMLPCRTPNVCRLLCNCYYFAGDEECGELAGRLVMEALGYIRGGDRGVLLTWWDAICLYDDVIGTMELPKEEQERLNEERARLLGSVEREENERIECFRQMGQDADMGLVAEVFYILAKREFEMCNGLHGKK